MKLTDRQIKNAIDFLIECRKSYQALKNDHVLGNMKAMQILGIESTLLALGIEYPKEELK